MKFYASFLAFLSPLALTFAELNLENIQLVFRHGARTPQYEEVDLLNFAHPKNYEPWGYGELIDVGMEQLFRFGRFLRGRYGEFLGNYNEKEVFARSSNKTRTKQSLQCLFAGLYLPEDPENIQNLILGPKIQTFAFQFVPEKEDVVLRSQNCKM